MFTYSNQSYCTKCPQKTSIQFMDDFSPTLNEKRRNRNVRRFDASIFDGIKVKTINGDEILLSDTWKNRPVILKVLASLGCALCKYDAKVFSELQPLFEHHNVGLVAVVFEDVDLYSFLSSGYWTWDIYLDPERNVYKAAKLTKISRAYQLKAFFSKHILKMVRYIKTKGLKLNMKADLRQLGGTFLINPNNEIVYSFRPKELAIYPSIKEIYSLVGGDPGEIDEQLPEEYVYTQKKLEEKSISSSSILTAGSYN